MRGPKEAKRWQGSVNLKVHYIHSKVKLLSDIVRDNEMLLEEET